MPSIHDIFLNLKKNFQKQKNAPYFKLNNEIDELKAQCKQFNNEINEIYLRIEGSKSTVVQANAMAIGPNSNLNKTDKQLNILIYQLEEQQKILLSKIDGAVKNLNLNSKKITTHDNDTLKAQLGIAKSLVNEKLFIMGENQQISRAKYVLDGLKQYRDTQERMKQSDFKFPQLPEIPKTPKK